MKRTHVALTTIAVAAVVFFCLLVYAAPGRDVEADDLSASTPTPLSAVPLPRISQFPPDYAFTVSPALTRQTSPAALPVYQIVHIQPTRDMICDLARKAGIEVSEERYALLPETIAGRSYYMATLGTMSETSLGNADVTLYDNGAFMLTFRDRSPEPTDEAPSDEAARAAADAFLAESGLLPPGTVFVRIAEGQSTETTADQGETWQKVLNSKVVLYERRLNGIPAGSLQVEVNGKEQVFSVRQNIRNLAPMEEYPLLSIAEAVDMVKQGNATLAGPYKPGETLPATIESVSLMYFEGPPLMDLDTVQPVYVFSGPVEGYPRGFRAYVHAVRPEYLTGLD